MKKKRKNVFWGITFLFTCLFCCLSCAVEGNREESRPPIQEKDEQGVYYQRNMDGTEYMVKALHDDYVPKIIIPSTYNGLPVTKVERYAFYDRDSLQSVILSEGIVSIGESAFSDCDLLAQIELPQSLREVGNYAFENCNLTYHEENDMFYLGNSNNHYLYLSIASENIAKAEIATGCRFIAPYAFFACKKLTEVYLPYGVMCIGRQAFEGCENLKKVVLPHGLEIIGSFVFAWCSSLKEIDFQGTVQEWESIDRIWDWRYDCFLEKIICSDRVLYI
jgi:hypothetical protein